MTAPSEELTIHSRLILDKRVYCSTENCDENFDIPAFTLVLKRRLTDENKSFQDYASTNITEGTVTCRKCSSKYILRNPAEKVIQDMPVERSGKSMKEDKLIREALSSLEDIRLTRI